MGQPTSFGTTVFPQTMVPPPAQPAAQAPPPPAQPPQESSNSTNTTLLSETRQQTTEVRLEIQKISTKVEDIANKIDKLREERGVSGGGALVGRGPTPSMETSVLLHNIQRIIQVRWLEMCKCKKGYCQVCFFFVGK